MYIRLLQKIWFSDMTRTRRGIYDFEKDIAKEATGVPSQPSQWVTHGKEQGAASKNTWQNLVHCAAKRLYSPNILAHPKRKTQNFLSDAKRELVVLYRLPPVCTPNLNTGSVFLNWSAHWNRKHLIIIMVVKARYIPPHGSQTPSDSTYTGRWWNIWSCHTKI